MNLILHLPQPVGIQIRTGETQVGIWNFVHFFINMFRSNQRWFVLFRLAPLIAHHDFCLPQFFFKLTPSLKLWIQLLNGFHPVVYRFSHKWCPQFLAPMKLSRIDDWSVQRSISADGTGGGQGGYLLPPLHILAEPLTLFKRGGQIMPTTLLLLPL